jgi:hypothetical protein
LETSSTFFGSFYLSPDLVEKYDADYAQLRLRRTTDEAHAQETLPQTIASVYTTIDYIPLSSFA